VCRGDGNIREKSRAVMGSCSTEPGRYGKWHGKRHPIELETILIGGVEASQVSAAVMPVSNFGSDVVGPLGMEFFGSI
jgi:hypothetical protein